MLENYGLLYAKGELHNYKGKWLWYTAMGGRIGDSLYMQKQKECAEADVAFTEELLLFDLMKLQCGGNAKPKRRSRLHKEYKRLWPTGRDEENKKGEQDGGDGATIDERVKMGESETGGGTYNNAIGVLNSVISKGGPIHKVNKIPALILLSGVGYTMDSNRISDKFKNLSSMGKMIPMTFFTYHPTMMDLFLETVVELSKRMEEIYGGRFKGMHSRAKKIVHNAKNNQDKISEKVRVKDASKFWDDFGEPLIRSLYTLNGQDDKYAKTDKLLFLESENPVFAKYNNLMHGEITKNQIEYAKDLDIMTDCYNGENLAGTSGLSMYKCVKQALKGSQGGGFVHSTLGKQMWYEIWAELNPDPNCSTSILNKTYSNDKQEDIDAKRSLYRENIRGIVGAILANHGSRGQILDGLFAPTGQLYNLKKKLGVDIPRDFRNLSSGIPGETGVNDKEVMSGKNAGVESLLDKIVDGIIQKDGQRGKTIINSDDVTRQAMETSENVIFMTEKETNKKNKMIKRSKNRDDDLYDDDYSEAA